MHHRLEDQTWHLEQSAEESLGLGLCGKAVEVQNGLHSFGFSGEPKDFSCRLCVTWEDVGKKLPCSDMFVVMPPFPVEA